MNVSQADHPLRTWRKSQGMSQQALGEKIGVGGSQISMVENGVRGLSLAAAAKLHSMAEGEVPLDKLIGPSPEAAA